MSCPLFGIPGFTKHLSTKTTLVIFISFVVVFCVLTLQAIKGMSRGPQPQHWATAIEVTFEFFHPFIVWMNKSKKKKKHVCVLDCFDSGNK